MSQSISMKDLLEAGVHFGHQSKRWNPKMKPYIFTARNGVHVIDLAKTAPMLQTAYNFVRDTVANGGTIIFVGSKKQARHIITEEAQRAGAMYMTERWLGGLLTNFDSMKKSLRKLEQLKAQKEAGEHRQFTKKEQAIIDHEINRLQRLLGGIEGLKSLPQALFVLDPHKEDIAVIEANQTGIPVVAVVDTNCDPTQIDYPIPGNDDALKAIKLFVAHIADAVLEGKALAKDNGQENAQTKDAAAELDSASTNPAVSPDAVPASAKRTRTTPPAGGKEKGAAGVIESGSAQPQELVADAPHTPAEAKTEDGAAEVEEALLTKDAPKKSTSKTKATSATTKTSKEPKNVTK